MPPANATPLPDGIAAAISREQMANLPIRRYEGEICLVQTAPDLQRARADLLEETIVGFDTETRPSFRKGESHLPCLVQAATARAVYLFRLEHADAFPLLADLLRRPDTLKVGIGLKDDLRSLGQVFPFERNGILDIGDLAGHNGFDQTGLRNLAGIFLGFRIPKGAKTSNWAARQLTSSQVSYAATDAWACRELYLRFRSLGIGAAPQ